MLSLVATPLGSQTSSRRIPTSRISSIAWACCILSLLACGDPVGPDTEEATAYLNRALDLIEAHSIRRYVIDWESYRERAFLFAVGAETPADTYAAIRYAVAELADHHSSFFPPAQGGQSAQTQPSTVSAPPDPDGWLLRERIGMVRLYGFLGAEGQVQHADTIQAVLRQLDDPTVCGWIVDLRLNTGGNMWPMVAGVGPILGEGYLGAFVDPDSVWTYWWYEDGAAGIEESSRTTWVTVTGRPYEPFRLDPNVAVLTGPITGSSGEAVAVAFRGRPKARSFGQGSRGASTSLAHYTLSDGAKLRIANATFADRTGRLYGGVLEPDEYVEGEVADDPTSGDPVVDAAVAWLLSRDDCTIQP